jgi:hypothetical protein
MPSSAEVLAYELEHGESDLKCSGKGRSKSERVENKHSDQNTNNRMIVNVAKNGQEKRRGK